MRFFHTVFLAAILVATSPTTAEVTKAEFSKTYRAYQKAVAENDFNAAKELAKAAYELGREIYGTDHITTAILALNYSRELTSHQKQRAPLEKALDVYEREYGKDSEELIDVLFELGHAENKTGKYKGKKDHMRALKLAKKHYGETSEVTGSMYLEIGQTMLSPVASPHATTYLKKAKEIFESLDNGDYRIMIAKADFWLGKYKLAKKRNKSATEDLLNALETLETHAPNAPLTMSTHSFLIEAYERQGKREDATKHCLAIGKAQPYRENQDYLPVYMKRPVYPTNANRAGIEGFAIIELTVDEKGFVQNPHVTETQGSKKFAEAAMDVINDFRYIPRFENGVPVETTGVEYKFTFKLTN